MMLLFHTRYHCLADVQCLEGSTPYECTVAKKWLPRYASHLDTEVRTFRRLDLR